MLHLKICAKKLVKIVYVSRSADYQYQYVLAPPNNPQPTIKYVPFPTDVLNLIFSRCLSSFSFIRLTCKSWDQWFEKQVKLLAPECNDRFDQILQTVRIFRIASNQYNSFTPTQNNTGNLRECVFERKRVPNSKVQFLYRAAVTNGGTCHIESNEIFKGLYRTLVTNVNDVSSFGTYENRIWLLKTPSHLSLHRYCEERRVEVRSLDIGDFLEVEENANFTEAKIHQDSLVLIVNKKRLIYKDLKKGNQFEIPFPDKEIDLFEIGGDQIFIAASDGSLEMLKFSEEDPIVAEEPKVRRRSRSKKKIKTRKEKIKILSIKSRILEVKSPGIANPSGIAKYKFYSVSVITKSSSQSNYRRTSIIPSDPVVRITALKVKSGRLFVGKSNGTLSVLENGSPLVDFAKVHENAIEYLAIDGSVIFSISNFPTTVIKCHHLASRRLELITQYVYNDSRPGRIFYGEGIFIKGEYDGKFTGYDYNLQKVL